MKILQLCKKFPYPLKDGESIAITYLSKALHELGCEVTLLSMNTTKHFYDIASLPEAYNHYTAIHTVLVDNRIRWQDALFNLFSSKSYHVSRFISKDFQNQLLYLLQSENFDIIQLETLYLAPYIPIIKKYSHAPIVMRAHNIEHEIWERVAENTKFLPLKWYLKHITNKLKKYEVARLKDYDLLVAITKRDLNLYHKLGFRKAAIVTPVGLEVQNYIPDHTTFYQMPSISFIGSLDWIPNQEGLNWFLQEVWTKLYPKYPNLILHIAGRNTPQHILALKIPQVVIHGEVEDAKNFINQHTIMIVPLLSGSGIRVKILEGLALGKVVLTTSIGLEGIHAINGKEIMIADNAIAFANCIENCLEQPHKLKQIGQQARKLIESEFDNIHIARKLLKTYKKMLGKIEGNSKSKAIKISV